MGKKERGEERQRQKCITNLWPAETHEGESLYTEPDPRGTWNHATTFQQSDPRAVKIRYIRRLFLIGNDNSMKIKLQILHENKMSNFLEIT